MQHIQNKKRKGFTLVELITVIAVLVVLGVAAVFAFQNIAGQAQDASDLSIAQNIVDNLNMANSVTRPIGVGVEGSRASWTYTYNPGSDSEGDFVGNLTGAPESFGPDLPSVPNGMTRATIVTDIRTHYVEENLSVTVESTRFPGIIERVEFVEGVYVVNSQARNADGALPPLPGSGSPSGE